MTVVFNDEDRVLDTLQSVAAQQYSNLEYIIIDGLSKDRTLDIIVKSGTKVDQLISESDRGIYDAMNKGVVHCTGDYVLFLNAGDTFYHDNTLTEVFVYEDASKYDVIYGKHIWDYGSYSKESVERPIELMDVTLPFCHQASLTKREVLLDYPFDLKYKIIADYDFFRKVYKKGYKFLYRPVFIVNYQCQGGFSADNMVGVYKENYLITKDLNVFFRMYSFSKKVGLFYVKNFVKALLPEHFQRYIKQKL